jgi:hypothetical protein
MAGQTVGAKAGLALVPAARRPVARRAETREQGEALEMLGHAIEYLMDTRLEGGYRLMRFAGTPEFEAVQILMRANRELYASFPEVKPLGSRLRALLLQGGKRRGVLSSVHDEVRH